MRQPSTIEAHFGGKQANFLPYFVPQDPYLLLSQLPASSAETGPRAELKQNTGRPASEGGARAHRDKRNFRVQSEMQMAVSFWDFLDLILQ